jgi:hypothetical protein
LVIRAFFNGTFLEFGTILFRYPVITTEMEDTYWIDIYNAGKASGYGASLYIIGLMPVDEGRKCGINISKQSFIIINSYR